MSTPMGVTQVPKNPRDLFIFKDFLPEFAYKAEGIPDTQEANENYESFLEENFELIVTQMQNRGIPYTEMDGYLKGFRDAIAITELWLSSLTVGEDIKE